MDDILIKKLSTLTGVFSIVLLVLALTLTIYQAGQPTQTSSKAANKPTVVPQITATPSPTPTPKRTPSDQP